MAPPVWSRRLLPRAPLALFPVSRHLGGEQLVDLEGARLERGRPAWIEPIIDPMRRPAIGRAHALHGELAQLEALFLLEAAADKEIDVRLCNRMLFIHRRCLAGRDLVDPDLRFRDRDVSG